MESVEAQLEDLLRGRALDAGHIDIQIQNSVPASPSEEGNGADYVPIAKETVGYIVCGIVMNDDGDILMMQEAKTTCYGEWYLPAGRMEPNETIVEGVKREVLEETGIVFEPSTLLSVEVASGFWYRFTLTGKVTGGELKDYEKRDKDSLQAKWATIDEIKSGRKEFPLRAHDILPLIDIAVKNTSRVRKYPDILPLHRYHSQLLLRTVLVRTPDSGGTEVLIGKSEGPHLPVCMISDTDFSLQVTIFRLLKDVFDMLRDVTPAVRGVLTVEHAGKPAKKFDGICLTLLVTLTTKTPELLDGVDDAKYAWHALSNDQLAADLLEKMEDGMCVPLLMLR